MAHGFRGFRPWPATSTAFRPVVRQKHDGRRVQCKKAVHCYHGQQAAEVMGARYIPFHGTPQGPSSFNWAPPHSAHSATNSSLS
jgi:hypothetical protein